MKLPADFEGKFNKALVFGLENIAEIVKIEQRFYENVDISDYFANNISFNLDYDKRAGMKKFLELARKLEFVEL